MSWFTYFSVIVRLFKVDPSKGKIPRDPTALERCDAKELLESAKARVKERTYLTSGYWSLLTLNFEALMSQALTCRPSKFGRIIEQGTRQMRSELDLFSFLKKMKELTATIDAVTTFEQRRMIRQQVKAGLLVAPYDPTNVKDKSKDPKGKRAPRLWASSDEDTSSEEDFNFLEERLATKKNLSPEDMRYLRGILQPPFKDRKHPERMKRKWAQGETDVSDSDDYLYGGRNKITPLKRGLEE